MNLKSLPHKPGVYLFKDERSSVIYVGKAIDLRNRISSYFQNKANLLPKTALMIQKVAEVEHIRVESEIEALILEASLIKKYRPYYNFRLKDDKDYLYIKITKEDFPTVLLSRSRELKGSLKYFGPFPNSSATRMTYKLLRKLFPYRTCKVGAGKACFYYHIGLCLGPCIGQVDKKTYRLMIRRMTAFLEGKIDQTIKDLSSDMNEASSEHRFERAGQIKKQIEAIRYVTQEKRFGYDENPNLIEDIREKSLVELASAIGMSGQKLTRIEAYDNSNISGTLATTSMVVFTQGEPDKSHYRKFRIKTVGGMDDYAFFKEVLKRRFRKNRVTPDESFASLPDLLVIDGGRGQLSTVVKVLSELGLQIPAIGLAKRLEEVYLPGERVPLRLPRDSEALKLLQRLRDEAHRFALLYHRKLRRQTLLSGSI